MDNWKRRISMWKRDSMLSGVCSLVDHRWRWNMVRRKRGTRGAAECATVVANVNISVIVSVDNFASLIDPLIPIFVSGVELTCIFCLSLFKVYFKFLIHQPFWHFLQCFQRVYYKRWRSNRSPCCISARQWSWLRGTLKHRKVFLTIVSYRWSSEVEIWRDTSRV